MFKKSVNLSNYSSPPETTPSDPNNNGGGPCESCPCGGPGGTGGGTGGGFDGGGGFGGCSGNGPIGRGMRSGGEGTIASSRGKGTGSCPPGNTGPGSGSGPDTCCNNNNGNDSTDWTASPFIPVGGDPVFLTNGEFRYHVSDIFVPGRGLNIDFTRSYGSRREYNGRFGYGWDINYNLKIRRLYDPDRILMINGKGCKFEYVKDSVNPNIYYRGTDHSYYFEYQPASGVFKLVRNDGITLNFDIDGNLAAIHDNNGNSLTFTYQQDAFGNNLLLPVYGPSEFFVPEELGGPVNGRGLIAMEYRLVKVTDDLGEDYTLGYNASGLLTSITDYAGRMWSYYYDPATNDLLVAVTPPTEDFPNGIATIYHYDDKHNMVSIEDHYGRTVVTNFYNSEDKVWKQTVGEGDYLFTYDQSNRTATIIDREGHRSQIVYDAAGNVLRRTVFTDDPGAEPNTYTTRMFYDSKNRRTRIQYPLGNCVDYVYNDNNKVIGIYRKTSPSDPNALSHPNVAATLYEYDTTHINKVSKITDAEGNETYYEFDLSGNVKKITYPTVDTPQGPKTATVRYTYNSYGQVETITNSDDVVTTNIYYDEYSGRSVGQLWKTIVDDGTDPQCLKLTTIYTYDTLGRLYTITDPEGDTTTLEYNNLDQVVKVTGPAPFNYETRFSYDARGNRIRIKQQTSDEQNPWQITAFAYDANRKLMSTTDAMDNTISYTYDKNGRRKTATNALDQITRYTYDEQGQLVKVTDPNDNDTLYAYDLNGNRTSITDTEGKITFYDYDGLDRLVAVTDPEGHYRIRTLDKQGRVIREIAYDCKGTPEDEQDDVALMQTRFAYNEAGDLIEYAIMADADAQTAVDPHIDSVTRYAYAWANGPMVEETRYYGGDGVNPATAAVTTHLYDALGRRTQTEDPDGNITDYVYNAAGRLERVKKLNINPIGDDILQTTDFVYDELGRLTYRIEKPENSDDQSDASWQTTEYAYDALGNVTAEIRPNGVIVAYEYDLLGRKTRMVVDPYDAQTNPDGIHQATEYGYDALGRQVWIAGYADNTNSNTRQMTEYEYDNLGRITKITYPDAATIQYAYTPAGKVSKRTDQRGWETFYRYDDGYNMTQKEVKIGANTIALESFTYDGLGRMLTAVKQEGQNIISESIFTYNALGRMSDAWETYLGLSQKHIGYAYDNAGNRIQTVYPNSVQIGRTNHWSGKINTLKYGTTTIIDYAYVGDRVAQRKSGPSIYYAPEYDNLGRMTRAYTYRAGTPNTTITDFVYTYGPTDNNIAEIRFDHRPSTPYNGYAYDNLDRLTEAEYLVGLLNEDEVFGMDDLGNRTTVNLRSGADQVYTTDTPNITNRYTAVGGQPLAYDAAGNLIQDPDGYRYVYDYENRITRIFKLDGQTEIDVAHYAYDALGRRICKTSYDSVPSVATLYYYSDNWQVLAEYDGSGGVQAYYVFGNYIDEVLLMHRDTADHYYLHDHLYSPVALLDDDGDVLERYEYDAYGTCRILDSNFDIRASSLYGNPYALTGRQLDTLDNNTLHHMHYRHRDYSPQLGRFMQHDPLGINPFELSGNFFKIDMFLYWDGLNLYEHILSNPMIGDDPFGLSSWRKIGRGIGRIGRWIPYIRVLPNCVDALTGGADGAQPDYYSDCFDPQDCSSGLSPSQSCQLCVTNRAAKAGVMQGVPGFGIGIPETLIGIIKPPLAIIGAIDLVCTFKNLSDIKDMFNEMYEKCEKLKD